ncbi:MAG: OmcA/MtrC family decaheme c-type cytochrome [Candidatus Solibacter usitatus]|nr:OmcA/MtrC family decaheme c-type cytochrome [Candidatus Solibacter usitatus]
MKWALVVMVLVASTALVSSTKSPFTPQDKAYYADEALVNFVRPGLVFKIISHEIAADGTVKVRFKMTDPKGVALEREGINTPGVVTTSFVLSTIPNESKWQQPYTTRLKTSTYAPTAGKQARQASTDTGGTYAKAADGEYVYTFGLKLPAAYQKNATHTIVVFGNRNLSEFGMSTNYATDIYNFVPDGTPVKKIREVFKSASCNKCHDNLRFHGGSRVGVEACVICHVPQYATGGQTVSNLNPETDNTIDMTVMIHKIHMGSELPSVVGGKPYQIIGYGNAVSDFSYVNMPSRTNNCQWCHEKGNEQAAQKDAWLMQPTRAACGACHDTVNFQTGQGHVNLPQPSDSQCANCHIPQGEIDFDASIKGAHVVEQDSALVRGVIAKFVNIENTKPGQKPTITFSLTDRSGTAMDINELIPGAGRGRIGFTLAALTGGDYGQGISTATTRGYVQDAPTATTGFTGTPGLYKYTIATAIPADAKGTWAMQIEGRSDEKVLAGTLKERIVEVNLPNQVRYFSVDSSAVAPRRTVANTATCNNCHSNLALHGLNRNAVESCIICHNPAMTDAARRPADKMPAESISLASMVHRIHTGDDQPNGYVLYGRGGAADFSKATFPPPAITAKCTMCHVSGTENAPARGTANVTDPRGWITPVGPTSAACLACHSSKDVASHALANTTTLGESCAACHGPNSEFAVSKVHAQ